MTSLDRYMARLIALPLFSTLVISAMLLVAPLFSASSLSIPLRVITSLAISVMLVQAVPTPKIDLLSPLGAMAIAGEVIVGAAIGFIFQFKKRYSTNYSSSFNSKATSLRRKTKSQGAL